MNRAVNRGICSAGRNPLGSGLAIVPIWQGRLPSFVRINVQGARSVTASLRVRSCCRNPRGNRRRWGREPACTCQCNTPPRARRRGVMRSRRPWRRQTKAAPSASGQPLRRRRRDRCSDENANATRIAPRSASTRDEATNRRATAARPRRVPSRSPPRRRTTRTTRPGRFLRPPRSRRRRAGSS